MDHSSSSSTSSNGTSSNSTFDDDIPETSDNNNNNDDEWNTRTILQALVLFLLTGLAEIGGGWLVWKAVRGSGSGSGDSNNNNNNKQQRAPWWWAVAGSVVLIVYGFLPTLQPVDEFGRIYAAYGGFFIFLSLLWGWGLDGDRPDIGDVIGSVIALVGVLVLLFWPRGTTTTAAI